LRTVPACLCFAVSVCACSAAAGEPRGPLVLAYYYTWYGAEHGACGAFEHWGEGAPNLRFPPAIRDISSSAYPLIGPYDSMEPEVVRWHMRLAKAAGIDGFLVDWWGPADWQKPAGWTHDVFVKTVLPVAEQERFPVALFDECPQFVDSFDSVRDWTVRYLRQFKDSPAWLHIDGKPAWGVYQLWEGKLSPEQGRELVAAVEAEVGPVYWVVDRMRARQGPGGLELYTPDEWLAIPQIQCFSGYAMFSTWRMYRYEELAPVYRGFVERLHAAGKAAMLPVHPGHDNRRIADEPWVMPRDDGATLRAFWRAAVEADCDLIGITSFNEWPETTVIEPALTWPDPYRYLRIVAELQGRGFEPPPLPPAAAVDPAIREMLAARSAESGRAAP